MFKLIDHILDRITMYRLVLYYLSGMFCISLVLASLNVLHFSPLGLLFSAGVILTASFVANRLSANFFGIPENVESVYITSLILTLILTPSDPTQLAASLPVLLGASVFAEVSKYALNFNGKHIFNPAALGVALTALGISQSASWWVGSSPLLVPGLLGSLLILRKVRRFSLGLAFAVSSVLVTWILSEGNLFSVLEQLFFASPFVFFAGIMLTEPITMPPTRYRQIAYGIVTGWLFSPLIHFGTFYLTPEYALLGGNIFSFFISPKFRHALKFLKTNEISKGIKEFIFQSPKPLKFLPGQYMEWTLGQNRTDSRGNRRYLTIASSPTEKEVLIGVRFYERPSAFKQTLQKLSPGNLIFAGQLAGDFVMAEDKSQKLAFLAGGIGITPFRSMVKYLVDTGERRDVVMLYSTGKEEEIAYKNIWQEAEKKLGIVTHYSLINPGETWKGLRGFVNKENIEQAIPDYKERIFYISGSQRMVEGAKEALSDLGVKGSNIKTDFFPGLA